MKLTAAQMMRSDQTDREWADWFVEDILKTEFPNNYKYGPPHVAKEQSRNALLWLRHFGIERRDLQAQVMTIMWGLAPNFFEHPEFHKILTQKGLSEADKVDRLYGVPDRFGGEAYDAADFNYWYPWRVPNNVLGLSEDPTLFDDLADDEGHDG